MKRLFIISLLFVVLGMTVNAQQYKHTFSADTVQGDTTYFPSSSSDPNTLRPSTGIKSTISTGVISFDFSKTDVADSLAFIRWEGSDDGTNWTPLTGNAALAATSTDGKSKIYLSTPLIYLYHRVAMGCATGDTVSVTAPQIIYKEK